MRTNYFLVKDEAKFIAWCKHRDFAVVSNEQGWGFKSLGGSEFSDENGETEPLTKELANLLVRGQVAIVMETGTDNLFSLWGRAIAIQWNRKPIIIDINDIYNMVRKKWGQEPTLAEG